MSDKMNPLNKISKRKKQYFDEEANSAAFEALKDNFNGENEFYNFIDTLPEPLKVKFIMCGVFYNEAKLVHKKANIKLIMILSIIEEINSKEEFKDFKSWCDNKQNTKINLNEYTSFDELLKYLKIEYHKMHGSKQKTTTFFESYLKENDKNILINSFKTEKYLWKNETLGFNEVVDILYQMRNTFLHSARFIPIHEDGSIGGNIKKNGKNFFVHSDLNIKEFERIFERAFIVCFKEKQQPKMQKKQII